MALIDVTEILTDPDFTDVVQIITRARTVNQYGENELTETNTGDYNLVVQPAKPSELERLPEGARLVDAINVWHKGVLSTEAAGGYSDIVVWRGERYAVVDNDDFGNYGAGYTKALCIRERPNA